MYTENIDQLRSQINNLTSEINSLQVFMKTDDYQKMDLTQQTFFDRQLDTTKELRKHIQGRYDYYRYYITSKRR